MNKNKHIVKRKLIKKTTKSIVKRKLVKKTTKRVVKRKLVKKINKKSKKSKNKGKRKTKNKINDNILNVINNRIVFIAYSDHANVLTEWSNAINKYNKLYQSKIICVKEHNFKYNLEHDYNLNSNNHKIIKDWILTSKYLILGYESSLNNYNAKFGFNILCNKQSQKILFHSGTLYRSKYKYINNNIHNLFNKIIYAPDLFRLSPLSSKDYVFFPIYSNDINIINIIEQKFNNDKLLILHCPSDVKLKGTDKIINIMNKLLLEPNIKSKFEFKVIYPPRLNSEIIEYKKKSVIYIDQITNNISTFGVTSIEALVYGNIVYTTMNNINDLYYNKINIESQNFPISNVKNELDLYNKLLMICSKTNEEIITEIKYKNYLYHKYLSSQYFSELFNINILN